MLKFTPTKGKVFQTGIVTPISFDTGIKIPISFPQIGTTTPISAIDPNQNIEVASQPFVNPYDQTNFDDIMKAADVPSAIRNSVIQDQSPIPTRKPNGLSFQTGIKPQTSPFVPLHNGKINVTEGKGGDSKDSVQRKIDRLLGTYRDDSPITTNIKPHGLFPGDIVDHFINRLYDNIVYYYGQDNGPISQSELCAIRLYTLHIKQRESAPIEAGAQYIAEEISKLLHGSDKILVTDQNIYVYEEDFALFRVINNENDLIAILTDIFKDFNKVRQYLLDDYSDLRKHYEEIYEGWKPDNLDYHNQKVIDDDKIFKLFVLSGLVEQVGKITRKNIQIVNKTIQNSAKTVMNKVQDNIKTFNERKKFDDLRADFKINIHELFYDCIDANGRINYIPYLDNYVLDLREYKIIPRTSYHRFRMDKPFLSSRYKAEYFTPMTRQEIEVKFRSKATIFYKFFNEVCSDFLNKQPRPDFKRFEQIMMSHAIGLTGEIDKYIFCYTSHHSNAAKSKIKEFLHMLGGANAETFNFQLLFEMAAKVHQTEARQLEYYRIGTIDEVPKNSGKVNDEMANRIAAGKGTWLNLRISMADHLNRFLATTTMYMFYNDMDIVNRRMIYIRMYAVFYSDENIHPSAIGYGGELLHGLVPYNTKNVNLTEDLFTYENLLEYLNVVCYYAHIYLTNHNEAEKIILHNQEQEKNDNLLLAFLHWMEFPYDMININEQNPKYLRVRKEEFYDAFQQYCVDMFVKLNDIPEPSKVYQDLRSKGYLVGEIMVFGHKYMGHLVVTYQTPVISDNVYYGLTPAIEQKFEVDQSRVLKAFFFKYEYCQTPMKFEDFYDQYVLFVREQKEKFKLEFSYVSKIELKKQIKMELNTLTDKWCNKQSKRPFHQREGEVLYCKLKASLDLNNPDKLVNWIYEIENFIKQHTQEAFNNKPKLEFKPHDEHFTNRRLIPTQKQNVQQYLEGNKVENVPLNKSAY